FPKDHSLRKKWVDSCNRHATWTSTRTSTICSIHFEPSQFQSLSNNRRRLKLDAMPTLFLNDPILEQVQHKQEIAVEKVMSKSQEKMISPQLSETSASNNIELTPRKRKLVDSLKAKTKKIKKLHSKVQYLEKKVSSLEEILKDVKKGRLSRKKFSPELRCFTLTLQYYSPKAYIYVRKTFGTTLPHPRTLTKWYSKLDGHPGFTKEALTALKSIKENNPNKNIYCALIFDEMKIKSGISWNVKAQRYYGYVDMGFGSSPDNSEEVTDALVFLLVGINTSWKVPFGFFLIHGINSVQKASLVSKALELIHETGIEVKTLTCDGPKVNIGMAEELACCMDPNNLQTSFLDPISGYLMYASNEVLQLCCMCEVIIRQGLEHGKLKKEYTTKFIVVKTSNKLIGQPIFANITCHDPDFFVSHSFELAKAVMYRYCDTRLRFLMKKSDPKKYIRHIYSKLIHFKNQ
ncbi:hypothetical protein ACJJTC_017561, partial [Scirpophaga incertulas]